MKPSLGRKVWCIYADEINEEEVGFIGKDSFIIDAYTDNRRLDSVQYLFEEYNSAWFTSFNRAKKVLLEQLHKKYKTKQFYIEKICDGYWVSRRLDK